MNKSAKHILTVIFISLFISPAFSQKDKLEGIWFNQEKTSKIEIYKTVAGTYAGKIVWLDEPIDTLTKKPKTDKENPDETKRSAGIMGLVILKGLKPDEDEKELYAGGTVYDPKNGKTYSCKITYKGASLDLRGYVMGLPFLGRTAVWTKTTL